MATTQTFSSMINEYLPNPLLKEELIKRDYLLTKVDKDNGWKTGDLIVPFKGATASSMAMGQLTAANDIAEDKYVRGTVPGAKEIWGTMIFNHRDLMEHDGSGISEKTFLRILPDAIEEFMSYMKNVVSCMLLNGEHLVTATATGTVGGVLKVDHPDRLQIGQKLIVDSSTQPAVPTYVRAIDMETLEVTLYNARTGGAPEDLSAYTVADGTKAYIENAIGNSFTSLKSSLLSASNGGSANLYGVSKLAYPYLQAINIDGVSVTAANILSKIFDAYVSIRTYGKGNPNEVIMSYKHLGSVLKALETSKGAFNVVPGSMETSVYGWTKVQVGGVKGLLTVVAVQELDDDVMMFIDWKALKFYSNGFFRKRKSPDGLEYFEQRSPSGYTYIVDMCLFGELVLQRPSYCGIMHSISY